MSIKLDVWMLSIKPFPVKLLPTAFLRLHASLNVAGNISTATLLKRAEENFEL